MNKGILYQTTRVREEKTYNLKNRSEHDRTVLIEHPFRPDFSLVSKDKPAERARDVYRFEVKLPAGKTASQEIVEERDVSTNIALTNSVRARPCASSSASRSSARKSRRRSVRRWN